MNLSRRSFTGLVTAAGLGAGLPTQATGQSVAMYRHGVASGDPLPSRVIIWTRITPAVDEAVIPVDWVIAYDAAFSLIRVKYFYRLRTTIIPFFLREGNSGRGGGNVGNAKRFPRAVGSGFCFPQPAISTVFFVV